MNLPYDKAIVDDAGEDKDIEPITPEEIKFEKMWDDYFEQRSNLAEGRLANLKKSS